jgi:hypothetical protein
MAASYDKLEAQIWNSVLKLFLHGQGTSLVRIMEQANKDEII